MSQRTDDATSNAQSASQSNQRETQSMNKTTGQTQLWSTSSFGGPPETSASELAASGAHLKRCTSRSARLSAFTCAGDALNDLAVTRTVTVAAVFAMLSVIGALVS